MRKQPKENGYCTPGATYTSPVSPQLCTVPPHTPLQCNRLSTPGAHRNVDAEFELYGRRVTAFKVFLHRADVLTYPRIRNSSFGVLKGWKESHCQVVSHVQQFVIVILNGHITKGLFGICNYYVGRKQASQNPIGKGKDLQVLTLT